MAYIKWILFSVFVNVYLCDAYKILLVFPLASRSHGILGDSMAKHLLKAGHEVTYITPYNRTEPHPRLTIVDVSAVIEFFSLTIADIRYWNYIQYSYYNINTGCNRSAPEDFKGGQAEDALNVKHIMDKTMNFRDPDKLTHLLIDVATTALENKNLQKFIRDPKQNFDVVVSEWMFSELYSVELKQTVIWKYEVNLPDLPQNVHIVHWAPQQSILAHPNCKFFITHGGLLSSIESVYFGVPIIGIPIWFDQVINVKKAEANGYALKVDFNNDLPRNLKSAMNTMLSDDKYSKKAKQLAAIYHDRFIKPGAELRHWVGHVIRTSGATHLRSPAINVPLYQRLYLDLSAIIILICCIIYYFLCMLTKRNNKNITKEKKQ